MTFSRLAPQRDAMSFACVRVRDEGYVAVAVPPTFDVDVHHAVVAGLEPLIAASKEMTPARKAWLLERLAEVRSDARERHAGGLPRPRTVGYPDR